MRWLIAEDDADIRMLITMMFTLWGNETMVFESGQKVWDWLDEVEKEGFAGPLPDFVLMDIRMPGKKGNEVARRMRTIDAFKTRPIVLMTAFSLSDAERAEMRTEDGVDDILAKPLPDFEELKTLLHNIHERKQSETAPSKDNGDLDEQLRPT
jgi:CheY-like chemotaxis protein